MLGEIIITAMALSAGVLFFYTIFNFIYKTYKLKVESQGFSPKSQEELQDLRYEVRKLTERVANLESIIVEEDMKEIQAGYNNEYKSEPINEDDITRTGMEELN